MFYSGFMLGLRGVYLCFILGCVWSDLGSSFGVLLTFYLGLVGSHFWFYLCSTWVLFGFYSYSTCVLCRFYLEYLGFLCCFFRLRCCIYLAFILGAILLRYDFYVA